MDEGIVASINGNLKFGDEDLKASGLFKFEYNNTGIAVEENFFVNGELVKLYVPKGPYTRFSGSGEIETVSSGQSLSGDFVFQKYDKAENLKVFGSGLKCFIFIWQPRSCRSNIERRCWCYGY